MINILELSIIVPVYNAAKTISLTIDSILSQTFKDFELIIVNDGSVDDSEFVIKKYRDNRESDVLLESNITLHIKILR
ncbi:hypothetical protein NUITMVRA1_16400 [Aerococcus viridans]|uniref:glycosyltransferase family 2 protein n=1 Tax=Aerococcus viridans TaxID=1377 RepID=UPI0028FD8B43|nr:hypothetical protein NUITMVRA1_16400 [Aerococcus viridans]